MTEKTYEIPVERLNTLADLTKVARAGDAARLLSEGRLHVNLDAGSAPAEDVAKRLRLSTPLLMMLSNLMLGAWEQAQIKVTLPRWESLRQQCARGGILFAMANHRRMDASSWEGIGTESREAWSRTWQPASAEFRHALFAAPRLPEAMHLPDSTIQPKLATFLNPHRAPRTNLALDINPNLTRPWLLRLVGEVPDDERGARDRLILDIGQIVEELLLNIRVHAGLRRHDYSYIQIFYTAGGGTQSANRLHVCVFDLGEGIPRTIGKRPRVPINSKDRMAAALAGTLPQYARDQGYGLSKVREIVQRENGRIVIATSAAEDLSAGSSIVTEFDASPGHESVEVFEDLPLMGTLIAVVLPLKWVAGARLARDAQNVHQLSLDVGSTEASPPRGE